MSRITFLEGKKLSQIQIQISYKERQTQNDMQCRRKLYIEKMNLSKHSMSYFSKFLVLISWGRNSVYILEPHTLSVKFATALTSVTQLRRAFAVNSLSTQQNSHLYNESSFDLNKNATENVSLRGLSWGPHKLSKTIVERQARVSVPLFIEINRESLYAIFCR